MALTAYSTPSRRLRARQTRPKPPAPSCSTMAKSLWKRECPRSPTLGRRPGRPPAGPSRACCTSCCMSSPSNRFCSRTEASVSSSSSSSSSMLSPMLACAPPPPPPPPDCLRTASCRVATPLLNEEPSLRRLAPNPPPPTPPPSPPPPPLRCLAGSFGGSSVAAAAGSTTGLRRPGGTTGGDSGTLSFGRGSSAAACSPTSLSSLPSPARACGRTGRYLPPFLRPPFFLAAAARRCCPMRACLGFGLGLGSGLGLRLGLGLGFGCCPDARLLLELGLDLGEPRRVARLLHRPFRRALRHGRLVVRLQELGGRVGERHQLRVPRELGHLCLQQRAELRQHHLARPAMIARLDGEQGWLDRIGGLESDEQPRVAVVGVGLVRARQDRQLHDLADAVAAVGRLIDEPLELVHEDALHNEQLLLLLVRRVERVRVVRHTVSPASLHDG
eukprot:scaffold117691_cov77-Phaeocystis_antarctica.AAC.12